MKKKKETKIRVTEKALYAGLFAVVLSCMMLFESTYAWFTQTVATPVSVIQTGNMSVNLVIADASAEETKFIDAGEPADANGEGNGNNLIFRNIDTGSTIFQPGETYCLPVIYVQNTGDIDLNFTVTLAHDPTKDEALSLYDVLEFSAYVVEDTVAEEPIPLIVAREGMDDVVENTSDTEDSTVNMIKGILEASQNEENIPTSKAIVIRVTMDKEAGIEYAGLKLSGLQIIVNATQIIPEEENQ